MDDYSALLDPRLDCGKMSVWRNNIWELDRGGIFGDWVSIEHAMYCILLIYIAWSAMHQARGLAELLLRACIVPHTFAPCTLINCCWKFSRHKDVVRSGSGELSREWDGHRPSVRGDGALGLGQLDCLGRSCRSTNLCLTVPPWRFCTTRGYSENSIIT